MHANPISVRRCAALLAIGGGLAGALALPADGTGAIKALEDDRLVSAPVSEIPERVRLLKQARPRGTSVDIFWGEVAPRRPGGRRYNPRLARNHNWSGYDWERVDTIMRAFKARGLRAVVGHVYDTPEWATGGRRAPFIRGTDQRQQWNPHAPRSARFFRDFQYAAAKRYNGRSIVRTPGRKRTRLRINLWEIWNEPNLKSFFRKGRGSSVRAYATLVRVAYPQIKRANRRATVIAGAAGPRSSTGGGNIGARPWMRALVNARNVRFDAYSQHIYCSQSPARTARRAARGLRTPFPCWGSIPEIHRTIARKRPGMKLYITEAGYTTASTPYRSARVSPRQQAAYLRQIFRLPAVRSRRTAMVIWFNYQDNPFWPGGLLREDGRRKPSFNAFRRTR